MRGRITLIALIASLALNLFLIAAGAAVIVLGARTGQIRPPQSGALRRAAMSLDLEHRAAFVTLLRTEGRAARPANQRARALRLAAWGSLAEPTFDAARSKQDLALARSLNQTTRATVEDGVVDFAATLPTPQRAALGAALIRTIPRNTRTPPTGDGARKHTLLPGAAR